MIVRFKHLRALALVVIGLAVTATSAAAQRRGREYRSRIDTTVAFDRNGTVMVHAGSGDVIITGGAANTVRVRANSDDDDIRFDATRTTVELSTARRGNDTRFEITVPLGTRIVARSNSGDIAVHGTRGEVSVTAQSGDVDVDDVNGRLEVRSFSGEIAAANAPFISRGDKSGTNAAELRYWKTAGLDAKGAGYKECGCGMGPALNIAASSGAYVLADRGTWLNFKNRGDLAVLVEGDTRLFNQYGVMVVNPARHPHVKAQDAQKFVDWVVSPAGQQAIAGYKIGGEQLFFPNASK